MSETDENKIGLEDLERAVTEATGSKATGRFAKLTFQGPDCAGQGQMASRADQIDTQTGRN